MSVWDDLEAEVDKLERRLSALRAGARLPETPYGVRCPECGAAEGSFCAAADGSRVVQHHARYEAWEAT